MNVQRETRSLFREMHARIRAGWIAHLAYLVLIALTYISLLMRINTLELSTATSTILVVMCIANLFFTLYGETLCEMRDSVPLKIVYSTIQITPSVSIFIVSKGAGFTSLLPIILVGHAEGLMLRNGALLPSGFCIMPSGHERSGLSHLENLVR